MSNLFSSSIGKKLVMSISGLFLIMFLLVHVTANLFILAGKDAFDAACGVMDYMVPIVPILAAGFIVHILYAFILTLQNRKARPVKYKVQDLKKSSTWQSRNMFVLGIIILGVLGLHLCDFWAKMQLQHFMGGEVENGYQLAILKFKNPVYVGVYTVWLVALWYHLRHGFWSAFQTVGLANQVWVKRWQCIANIYAFVVAAGFIIIPIYVYFFC